MVMVMVMVMVGFQGSMCAPPRSGVEPQESMSLVLSRTNLKVARDDVITLSLARREIQGKCLILSSISSS
jgi:hypothetical protein